MELFVFLQERMMGGKETFTIERKDLSEEAEVVWARYLKKLAAGEGEGQALGGHVGQVDAVGAEEGGGGSSGGGLKARGDDDQVILNPEP